MKMIAILMLFLVPATFAGENNSSSEPEHFMGTKGRLLIDAGALVGAGALFMQGVKLYQTPEALKALREVASNPSYLRKGSTSEHVLLNAKGMKIFAEKMKNVPVPTVLGVKSLGKVLGAVSIVAVTGMDLMILAQDTFSKPGPSIGVRIHGHSRRPHGKIEVESDSSVDEKNVDSKSSGK